MVQPSYRWHGEYALSVADSGGTVTVRWMTEREDSGAVRILDNRRQIYQSRTPPARAHAVTFKRPGAKQLTLIYGAASGPPDTTLVSLDVPARPRSVITGADSVFVIGDVHGKHDAMVQVLSLAGVIDADGRWSAGRSHLVFTGDMVDRGEDATRVLWFIYRLDREARSAGGAVHVVLGNHEIMEWAGDSRYLAPRESLLAVHHRACYACLLDIQKTVLGRWLASKPGIVQINDAIYVHGGVVPGWIRMGIPRFNDALHRLLREPVFTHLLEPDSVVGERFGWDVYRTRWNVFFGEDSPFWYRGYVQAAANAEARLDSVLSRLNAKVQVVGHTPVLEIVPLYDGKIVPVNVADFATQMILLTYPRGGARQTRRIALKGTPGSW